MKSFRVAVAGAGGIGRHHAKWHARAGSDVVAILGQRPERLPGTARILSELFGFHGRVYCDFGDLLGHEQPDIVDICAPNGAHYDLACQALDAGCHVLCEKPLVWGSSTDESLTQAEDLRQRAQHAGVHLGMCSQYAASLPQYRRLFRSLDLPASTSFSAEMETLSSHQPRDARAIWIDMGPHPLSLLLAVWPSATLLEESLQVRFAGRTAEASFTVRVDGHNCHCQITVRDRDRGPLTRRFAFDGYTVDLTGRGGDDGVYRSVMVAGDTEDLGDDFMQLLIEQFTRAVAGVDSLPLVPVETALRNLAFQASVLAAG
ncbi:MAG: Gfo/Idh/MocA family oxidoreductase [bacterium]|nr:Gfo/Idh/MocA family oxidoreductase [bacterium]